MLGKVNTVKSSVVSLFAEHGAPGCEIELRFTKSFALKSCTHQEKAGFTAVSDTTELKNAGPRVGGRAHCSYAAFPFRI
jgi:hypothetical protein